MEAGFQHTQQATYSHAKLLELVKAVQPGAADTFSITINESGEHDVQRAPSMRGSTVEDTSAT